MLICLAMGLVVVINFLCDLNNFFTGNNAALLLPHTTMDEGKLTIFLRPGNKSECINSIHLQYSHYC